MGLSQDHGSAQAGTGDYLLLSSGSQDSKLFTIGFEILRDRQGLLRRQGVDKNREGLQLAISPKTGPVALIVPL